MKKKKEETCQTLHRRYPIIVLFWCRDTTIKEVIKRLKKKDMKGKNCFVKKRENHKYKQYQHFSNFEKLLLH